MVCVRLNMDSAGWEEFRGTLFSEKEIEWSWFVARTDWSADYIYYTIWPGLTWISGRAFFKRELVGILAGLY